MSTDATGKIILLDTPGLSSARQATSGTGLIEAVRTDISTMALPGRILPFYRPPVITPGRVPESRRSTNNNEESDLRKGLLSLLSFNPEPDQPSDEDIGPRPTHHLPL